MEQLPGQMSMFDIHNEDMFEGYTWQRYIGQRVKTTYGKEGVIERIDRYYTLIRCDNGNYCQGTPRTCYPAKEEEKNGN